MTNSKKFRTALEDIAKQQMDLSTSARPYFEEFHSFVSFSREVSEYIQCDNPLPPAYLFQLNTTETNSFGLPYSYTGWQDTQHLVMPYAYIDDPKAWEAQFLQRVTEDRNIASEVFHHKFGKDVEYYNILCTIPHSGLEDEEWLLLEVEFYPNSDLADYQYFIVSKATRKLYSSANIENILAGTVPAVGEKHTPTPEQLIRAAKRTPRHGIESEIKE